MRAALALALALIAAPAAAQQIALTFDDLPAHDPLPAGESHLSVNRAILRALAEAKAPATGFVNGARVGDDPTGAEVLAAWRAAGHPLGNHTWKHGRLTANDAIAFEAAIVRNEELLKPLGEGWRWFRFPYLAEGETPEVRARARGFLAGRGYRIASVTLDFGDWAYNGAYARCRAKGDAAAIADLEQRFLAAASDSLDRARALSQRLYGRDVPLVLLLHVGAFDARMAPRLLDLYRRKGATFVSLEQAQADAFYRADTGALPRAEPLTLDNEARRRGLPLPPPVGVEGLDKVCR
ncbi:polysaccharide deacetylase family protein [Phenylobacterium sp.]|uniref:polysaccharide deacetylase family protein n=1 Tax=Phenylobacterium sp. TaxID=1871053 RepID=UPI002810ACF5|nr:polysaccharide deacetylase family protein [Phenylobacterium sp.]